MDSSILQDLSMLGGGGLMFIAYYVLLQATFRVIKNLMDRSVDSFTAAELWGFFLLNYPKLSWRRDGGSKI